MRRRFYKVTTSGAYVMRIGHHTWWLTATPYPMWEVTGGTLYMRCFTEVNYDPLDRLKRDLLEAHNDGASLSGVYHRYNLK